MPVQESDLTNLSKNIDSELKTLRDQLGGITTSSDLSELKDTVEQLKSNTTVLVKLAAAALAQLPNTFCVDNLEVPEYRNPQAGSDMPAVPPTIDPVIVPTTPPIGPPLKEAQQDPSTPQENAPGAPGLPATK
jgi:hypothetical protein